MSNVLKIDIFDVVGFFVDLGSLAILTKVFSFSPVYSRVGSVVLAILATLIVKTRSSFPEQLNNKNSAPCLTPRSIGLIINFVLYTCLVVSNCTCLNDPIIALSIASVFVLSLNLFPLRSFCFSDKTTLNPKILWFAKDLPILLIFLLLSGGVSILLGQDANWDLKNYHIYNPWCLLHWRYNRDLLAAGLQSLYSPLLDVPYYLFSFVFFPESPRAVSFLMGLPYGILSFILYKIYNTALSFYSNSLLRNIAVCLALSIGITGASLLPQVGTTINEAPTACFVLLSLYCAIKSVRSGSRSWILASGISAGLAVGVKLTAGLYIPGLILCNILSGKGWTSKLKNLFIFGSTSLIVFIACWGWWGALVYHQANHAVYPLCSLIFKALSSLYKPPGLLRMLVYPAFWVFPTQGGGVCELTFADPRFFLGFLSLILIGCFCFFNRKLHEHKLDKRDVLLLLFIIVSYIVWLFFLCGLRYAVSIEVLIPVIFIVLIKIVFPNKTAEKALILFLLVITGVLFCFTKYPGWGRADHTSSIKTVKTYEGKIEPGSLVVFLGGPMAPMAYIAPILSERAQDLSFLGIDEFVIGHKEFGLDPEIQARLDNHKGKIYAVLRWNRFDNKDYLARFGYKIPGFSDLWLFETKIDSFIIAPVCRGKAKGLPLKRQQGPGAATF